MAEMEMEMERAVVMVLLVVVESKLIHGVGGVMKSGEGGRRSLVGHEETERVKHSIQGPNVQTLPIPSQPSPPSPGFPPAPLTHSQKQNSNQTHTVNPKKASRSTGPNPQNTQNG